MKRDEFGFSRLYYAGRRTGSTVRALLGRDRTLDVTAVDAHLAGGVDSSRTCFAAVRAVPPGWETVEGGVRPWHAIAGGRTDGAVGSGAGVGSGVGAGSELGAALRVAVARIVASAPRPLAVALSGGLDSAIVLALVREIDPAVPALVLAPQLVGYSEVEIALESARVAGASARVLEVTAGDFVSAVPDAIAAFEAPLYNLHPVSKWLLATRARDAGFATVISGDGADQVFTRDVSADYLPLASAAFEPAGVGLQTPFLDEDVVAAILALPPDPEKRALRDLGATLPVTPALVRDRKISQLAPPMPLGIPAAKLHALAALLHRDLPAVPDVRWETLALLVDSFEAWH